MNRPISYYNQFLGLKRDRLTITGFYPRYYNGSNECFFKCVCDCGNEREVRQVLFFKLREYACIRCVRRYSISKGKKSMHPLYNTWYAMIDRCYSINHPSYRRYGGRGISVCDRWRNNLDNFIEDMGEKPSPTHSIDRINNNGNYEPSNCRWATMSEQQTNKNTTKLTNSQCFEINKKIADGVSLRELTKMYDTSIHNIRYSIKRVIKLKFHEKESGL